jgi:hypothetical protein
MSNPGCFSGDTTGTECFGCQGNNQEDNRVSQHGLMEVKLLTGNRKPKTHDVNSLQHWQFEKLYQVRPCQRTCILCPGWGFCAEFHTSDFILHRYQLVMQFSLGQMKSCFHRSQRDLPFTGDFALTHPFEKCEVDHLFLCLRQYSDCAVKEL